MTEKLTQQELEMIREALNYTKRSIQNYEHYPSYEFKQQRLNEVDTVRQKISQMIKETKND